MKFPLALMLGALALTTLTACANTWDGMGRDVENAGEEIQKSSGKYN